MSTAIAQKSQAQAARIAVECDQCGAKAGQRCIGKAPVCGCSTCAAIVRATNAGLLQCGGGNRELAEMDFWDRRRRQ